MAPAIGKALGGLGWVGLLRLEEAVLWSVSDYRRGPRTQGVGAAGPLAPARPGGRAERLPIWAPRLELSPRGSERVVGELGHWSLSLGVGRTPEPRPFTTVSFSLLSPVGSRGPF